MDDNARAIAEFYALRPWLVEEPQAPAPPQVDDNAQAIAEFYALRPWLVEEPEPPSPPAPEPGSWEEVVAMLPWLGEAWYAEPEEAEEAEGIETLRPWLRPDSACACTTGNEGCGEEEDGGEVEQDDEHAWFFKLKPWLVEPPRSIQNLREFVESAPDDVLLHHGWPDFPTVPLPAGKIVLFGPIVDIFLSAGRHRGYGTSPKGEHSWDSQAYRGCNRDDPRNCGIWRVTLRLGEDTPLVVNQIVYRTHETDPAEEWAGASMPALSPNGRYVAYRRQNYSDIHRPPATRAHSEIVVHDLSTGNEVTAAFSGVSPYAGKPDMASLRFPAWYNDEKLLYTRTEVEGGTLYEIDFDPVAFTFGRARAVMGPGSANFPDTLFDNPDVRHDDDFPFVSVHPNVVSFGTSASDDTGCGESTGSGVPRVHNLPRANGTGIRTVECFHLGHAATGGQRDVNSCQHPTWSLDGQTIYCWQKDPGDKWGRQESALKMTYAFGRSSQKGVSRPTSGGSSVWDVQKHMPFVPPRPEELEAMFGGLFPAQGYGASPQCLETSYKHAAECGNSNFMLMTLFCTDHEYNAFSEHSDVFASRIVLVRKNPLKLWDITAMIETEMAYTPNTLQGIYTTSKRILE